MQNNINTQLLDEELAKLKAIGLNEICKTTKLASSKIEDVLEKRFDKIDRVRAKGFIAILEREYNVDLRDWITLWQESQQEDAKSVSQVISKQDEEERTKRLAENVIKVQEKEKQKNKQKNYENQVLNLALSSESAKEPDTESYNWLYVILVLILLALMGYFAYKAFMQDHDEIVQKAPTTTQTAEDTYSQENSYDGIFFDTTHSQEDTASAQQMQEKQDSTETQEVNAQDMIQTPSAPEEQRHPEQNFFFNPQATADKSQSTQEAQSFQTTQPAQNQPIKDDILHIESTDDLWLGVINLETGSKEQFSYKKAYDIKLNHKMLFVMGHSSFTLTLNGETISHGAKHPVRMYYDGSTLKDVGYTTFKQLNGGVEW